MKKLTYVEATMEIVPLKNGDVIATSAFSSPEDSFLS